MELHLSLENHSQIIELLFNTLPFVFWKNKKGIYLGANTNQAKTFGFSHPSEFIGKTIFEILKDQKSAKMIDDTDNKIMQDGKTIIIEEQVPTPYGTKIFLSQKQPIRDFNKEIIGLLGFSMDITDIKTQQRKIEETNRKLIHEKYELEITAYQYQAEKKLQEKFLKFVNKIQNEIQFYKVEALNEKLGNDLQISEADKNMALTNRELQTLYYLSLNKSPKEISSILTILENKKIAPATIQSIITKQLYTKFNVYNISQLMEKVIALKLLPSFLKI